MLGGRDTAAPSKRKLKKKRPKAPPPPGTKALKLVKKKRKHVGPLLVVKKDLRDAGPNDERIKAWLATVPGLIEGLCQMNGQPVKLYDYQIAHCNNHSKFRSIKKSRQTGFSFGFASEALGKSQLCDINTSIFISYNQEEANEKMLVVKQLYESMPEQYKKKRTVDNKHSQVFVNSRGQMTRIISTAQRPPRGKGTNTDVYLDEFAFYMFADKIFTASAPVVSRGTGILTMGSTPFGAKGKFWQIVEHPLEYPQFSRQNVPWWHCPDLCTNVPEAFRLAYSISTEERVTRFGTSPLRVIFASMPIDDFQQEYELAFVDENVSYFPTHIIDACTYAAPDDSEYDEFGDKGRSVIIEKAERFPIETKYRNVLFYRCASLEELAFKVLGGAVSPNLYAGYDVGRRKDKSELTVTEEIELSPEVNLHVVRLCIQMDRKPFEEQKALLRQVMKTVPVRKLGIDAQGIGMNLAEDMDREFPGRVEQVALEGEWKDRAAQMMKIRFENQLVAIPQDEALKRQIGSIKKKVSDSGYVRYDADKDREHHGDKFWSLALACQMGNDTSARGVFFSPNGAQARMIANVVPGPSRGATVDAGYARETGQSEMGRVVTYEGLSLPGMGAIPAPIHSLLQPNSFGSDPWQSLSAFRTPTLKR